MSCNGWSNQFTWTVSLWLSNDENLSTRAVRFAAKAVNAKELAGQLRELVEEEVFNLLEPATLITDLLGTALDEVDWTELAEAWMSE